VRISGHFPYFGSSVLQPAANEDDYEKFEHDSSRSHVTVSCWGLTESADSRRQQHWLKGSHIIPLQWPKVLNSSLEEVDPDLFDIIEHEKNRQYKVRASSTRTHILTTFLTL
jgi:hypothetical protein